MTPPPFPIHPAVCCCARRVRVQAVWDLRLRVCLDCGRREFCYATPTPTRKEA